VLATFCVSGAALTAVGRSRKTQPEHTRDGRTAAQVLCTGGPGAAAAILWSVVPADASLRAVLYAAFLGSLAAAAADTWATEIGMLNATPPRLITTGQPVPSGTSGAVTVLGTLAGVAGAGTIAAVGAWDNVALLVTTAIAGTLAMTIDSVLGATVQATYHDPAGTISEVRHAGSGLKRGVPWVTNAVVNLAATLGGAVIAGALHLR
jgi:uncharacterized protein (TIGR00297 family)